jgi:branched-chain amino acid transport system substrate-binding protein
MKLHIACMLAGLGMASGAMAQEPLKIGFLSTFSGPEGVLGQEQKRGSDDRSR